MAHIFNKVGSLKVLKSLLEKNNLHHFKSINEILDFQKAFKSQKNEILSLHEAHIHQEVKNLREALESLQISKQNQENHIAQKLSTRIDNINYKLEKLQSPIPKNSISKWINSIRQSLLQWNLQKAKNNYQANIQTALSKIRKVEKKKSIRLAYLQDHFDKAVMESASKEIKKLENTHALLKELKPHIYGAIGEDQVVKSLAQLPDGYFIINDFNLFFDKSIYYSQADAYIKTIQIDHILVAPSGIFLIETKHWSEQSIQNHQFKSPIDQIYKNNFILYKVLNNQRLLSALTKHHWGKQRIAIKNILVCINHKPENSFEFVKIVTLKELLDYVLYFKPIYSPPEVAAIAQYLNSLNNNKDLTTH